VPVVIGAKSRGLNLDRYSTRILASGRDRNRSVDPPRTIRSQSARRSRAIVVRSISLRTRRFFCACRCKSHGVPRRRIGRPLTRGEKKETADLTGIRWLVRAIRSEYAQPCRLPVRNAGFRGFPIAIFDLPRRPACFFPSHR